MKLKKSTNNIIHIVDHKGYYLCNHAVGKHKQGVVECRIDLVTCKRCLQKYKKGEGPKKWFPGHYTKVRVRGMMVRKWVKGEWVIDNENIKSLCRNRGK